MLKYLSIRSVKAHRETIEATKALLLFGTPHQGQNATPEVYKIDEPVSGSSLFQVLRDLAKGSDYMRTYRETVTNLSAAYPQIQFFTMYETDCAPTYMKDVSSRIPPASEIWQVLTCQSETGEWNPDGGEAMVVPKESAMLWWPLEQHMAIPAHHHDMIKYETDATPTLFFLVVMDKIETEGS